MTERTAEEAKKDYIEKMGEELGTQFHALTGEVAWLHIKRAEFVELFDSDPINVVLLNKAAPAFFGAGDSLGGNTAAYLPSDRSARIEG